jgi:hypothetical protein
MSSRYRGVSDRFKETMGSMLGKGGLSDGVLVGMPLHSTFGPDFSASGWVFGLLATALQ